MLTNDQIFKLLNDDRKKEVRAQINQQQLAMGNTIILDDEWNTAGPLYRGMLLEKNPYFSTLYSYMYYAMVARAERYKNKHSRKYAEDQIKVWFYNGTLSGKYEISELMRANIKKGLEKLWKN